MKTCTYLVQNQNQPLGTDVCSPSHFKGLVTDMGLELEVGLEAGMAVRKPIGLSAQDL